MLPVSGKSSGKRVDEGCAQVRRMILGVMVRISFVTPLASEETLSVRDASARNGRFGLGSDDDLGLAKAERPPNSLSGRRFLSEPWDLADLVLRLEPRKKAEFRPAW
jgi:hypothetical protein